MTSSLDFDPEDYIDCIDTNALREELARRARKSAASAPTESVPSDIVDALRQAWREDDLIGFERALALIFDPEAEGKRVERVLSQYQTMLAERRGAQSPH